MTCLYPVTLAEFPLLVPSCWQLKSPPLRPFGPPLPLPGGEETLLHRRRFSSLDSFPGRGRGGERSEPEWGCLKMSFGYGGPWQ